MVEVGGADRVKLRGRLIEKHDLRVERERAGHAGALAHSAGELRGELMRSSRRQADHGELEEGEIVHHRLGQIEMLAHRHLDVLEDGQR